MKRAISAVLAAVILMVSCLSGCGGGGDSSWSKDTFPDNSNLSLSATEDEIAKAQDLVFYEPSKDLSYRIYDLKDGSKTEIAGIKFVSNYRFTPEGDFFSVAYSIIDVRPEEEIKNIFDTMKKQFDSVYGEAKEFSTDSGHSGYTWDFRDSKNAPYQALVKTYTSDDGNLYFTAAIEVITEG